MVEAESGQEAVRRVRWRGVRVQSVVPVWRENKTSQQSVSDGIHFGGGWTDAQ